MEDELYVFSALPEKTLNNSNNYFIDKNNKNKIYIYILRPLPVTEGPLGHFRYSFKRHFFRSTERNKQKKGETK